MNLLIVYALVFLFSALPLFEAYIVIPVGVIGGLNPVLALAVGVAGNVLTVFAVVFFINQLKEWLAERNRKKGKETDRKGTKASGLFKKYGVPGLSFFGPLVVGSHLAAFFAITLGGTRQGAFLWVSASVIFWSVLFSVLVHFGVDLFGFEDRQVLKRYLHE